MEVKWYGTAALAFSAGGKTILFDPFLPMNPNLPQPDLSELAACGDIFITHGHFDHLVDVPKVVASGGGPVFCSKTAAETLTREGVKQADIIVIKPGDLIERGLFRITVLRGKHIRFDRRLIMQTLFNRRVILHRSNLKLILRESRRYPAGEVLVYLIEVEGKKILHLGSLNLDENERYPDKVDVLTVPYQGRSDLPSYALKFVSRLQPETVFLHHFDDSFPPVSSPVDPQPFINSVKERFPGIRMIRPDAFRSVPC
jgi:L-ascorbate metabolism protein UlaG (beta-lactamase superfamily)